MIKISRAFTAAATAAVLYFTVSPVSAQPPGGGRGNFDPAQFRERMMERMKEQFEVTNDDEWKIIEPRLNAVMEAQRAARAGGNPFGFGGRRGNRGGNNGDNNGGRRGNRGGFPGAEPDPAAEALQQAIDDKAPAAELEQKLEAYRASKKEKEAKLNSAQADLRKVLSRRQEAMAVLMGFLD